MYMRKILIRFDDICPTMDFIQFEKALKVLQTYNVKPLLGIVPDCKDPELQIEPYHEEFWEYIRQLKNKGYKLAMHGYTHVYDSHKRGIVNIGFHSEFAGHTYQEQYEKIKKGIETLKANGIETDTFFAPSHSYDLNTLRALRENGFQYISDGMSTKPTLRKGIVCIPCRSAGVPKIKKKGYYTAVFHAHEWGRPEKASGFEELKRLCENYKDDIMDFDSYNDRAVSNSFVQILDEWIYVKYVRHIKPLLSHIKHIVFKQKHKGRSFCA